MSTTIATRHGQTFVQLTSASGSTAEVCLLGGTVTSWVPAGGRDVLFVSERSPFEKGRAIRGGIPVCAPWFGPRAGEPSAPAHGFVRTAVWEIEHLSADGAPAEARLRFDHPGGGLWKQPFTLRLTVALDPGLRVALAMENRGSEPFTFESALHTYFAVSDVREISVAGLGGASYLDKTDAFREKTMPPGDAVITAETDRTFPAHTATCVLHDPGFRRQITAAKSNSATTVLWNPGRTRGEAMQDLGPGQWEKFVCIEAGNTGTDAVALPPGSKHVLEARLDCTG